MRFVFPILLILASGAIIGISLANPAASDLLLIAGPCLVGGILVLLWTLFRGRTARKWAILDGSNVMHWQDQTVSIRPVQDVLAHLRKRGYTAGVVFDANAGYKLSGKYRHDGSLSRTLGLPEDRVMVVNKGEPADPMILTMARDMGAIVITDDRFRDWAGDFPEVRTKGHLVRGGYRDGALWLDLPDE